MLVYKGRQDRASNWRTTDEEDARWMKGARARLGDAYIFHHPRVLQLGISQDPSAGTLHFLDWDPADGRPALPLALVETRLGFGPLKLPVLAFPNHTLYVYSAAVPGLLPALLDPGLEVGAGLIRFYSRLPLHHSDVRSEVAPVGRPVVFAEDIAPRILLKERWKGEWNIYWNARDGVVKRARRREKQLRSEGSFEFGSATTLDDRALQVLERAMVHHSQRWGDAVNRESNLKDEDNRERTLELARHFDRLGIFRQDWILWKDDVAALVMGARSGSTWFFYWAAINQDATRYSPGNVLYKHMLEYAFSEGVEVADFMMGGAAYKERWSDSDPEVSTILDFPSNLAGHVLHRGFLLARRLKAATGKR